MKSTRFSLLALAALLAALLITSCNNSFGVFDSVRKDVAQSTSSDFKQTTVVNFSQFSSYYFAVMSAVYSRPVGGGSWRSVSLPGVGTAYSCTGIASDGSAIYISATSNDTTKPTSNIYKSVDGTSWTPYGTSGIPLVVSGDEYDQIDGIWLANGRLYAQMQYFKTTGTTATPYTGYTMYYDSGSGSFLASTAVLPSSTSATSDNPAPFMGVIYSGGDYYCAKGSTIYANTSPDFGSLTALTPLTASAQVLGMKASLATSGELLAWTSSKIYAWAPGGSLNSVSAPSLSTENVISDLQEVPVSGGYHLLVGTGTGDVSYTANGYWESNNTSFTDYSSYSGYVAGSSGTVAVSGNNSSFDTLFASKPVTKFYYDSAASRLFGCIAASGLTTSSYGLVSTYNISGSWNPDGWSAE